MTLNRPFSIPAGGLVSAMAAAPAWAQTLGQGSSADVPWWRVVGALVLCAGLAVGAGFVLKSRMRGGAMPAFGARSDRRLELVDTLRLSHQIDICVIKFDDKELLVAATASGAFVLCGDATTGGKT